MAGATDARQQHEQGPPRAAGVHNAAEVVAARMDAHVALQQAVSQYMGVEGCAAV